MFADTTQHGRRRVPHDEIQHHVDRIADLGRRLGLNRVNPDWNDGAFIGLLTTLLRGITVDNVCTLARLTFGQLGPAELMVQTDQAGAAGFGEDPDQFKGPLAAMDGGVANGYGVVTYFKILSNGVTGRMIVRGLYDVDPEDAAKLNITFVGFRLEPAFPDAQSLSLWREALAEHNPNMDASGGVEVAFEKRPRAALNYILMDPDYHLALAGSGALTTMKRTPPPPRG